MDRLRTFFVRKAGPLPVWAWVAIVVIVVLGYMYLRRLGPFGGSDAQAAVDPSSPGGASPSLYDPSAGGGGGGMPSYSSPAADIANSVSGTDAGSLAAQYAGATYSAPDLAAASTPGNIQLLASIAPQSVTQNYDPVYAAHINPPNQQFTIRGQSVSASQFLGVAPSNRFNPVRGRSSGTQAV